MKIFISIVSHGHGSIIERLNCLSIINSCENAYVFVRDNIGESSLKKYCTENRIDYQVNSSECGFAKNNNLNFERIKLIQSVEEDDVILIMNPDVYISRPEFLKFHVFMAESSFNFSSIIQFKDKDYQTVEASARDFASPLALVLERAFNRRRKLVPGVGLDSSFDWVSGAFVALRVKAYEDIGGFTESYFMYYEDADLALKCREKGWSLVVNTDIKSIHYAQYGNRKIFSRLFFISIRSYLKYIIRYYSLVLRGRLKAKHPC